MSRLRKTATSAPLSPALLVPQGAKPLIEQLQSRGVAVYLIR